MPTNRSAQTAVLYARVSTKDQEREGFSIPAQQKLLREYARTHGLTVLHEFVDVETAKQIGRRGFGSMLAFLKEHADCRIILVEKTDRLYRNIKDWTRIDDLALTIHFVKESRIVGPQSRSSEKLVHGMQVLMAKNYSDNLSEEVKKGLLEKAEQGHWPTVAHIGYVNNRETHRIEPDPVRGPLVAKMFELYASGGFSLQALRHKAREIGLTHWRGDRPLTKSEIHRTLQNSIYTGEFLWLGKRYQGSHTPLITQDTFQRAQAVLQHKPRGRYRKQRHPFMGLLKCARCGCTMTAEIKKGKYVYYRCTGFKGRCGNEYIREESLANLLGNTVRAITLPPEVAERLVCALRETDGREEHERQEAQQRLEDRRRKVLAKIDRGYDDYVEGRITEEFWTRRSEQWEDERRAVEGEIGRLNQSSAPLAVTAQNIIELAEKAEILYESQDSTEKRRVLEMVLSNCTFDRGTLCPTYTSPFDLFARGNETGDWRREWDSNPR